MLAHALVLERIAPPRMVWANDDPERPILALVKVRDIFSVSFAYDATTGSYLPQHLEWVRRPGRVSDAPTGAGDPADVAVRAFTEEMEAFAPADSKEGGVGDAAFMGKSTTFGVEQARWLLAPHAEALSVRARCEFLELPLQPLPDTSSWHIVPGSDLGFDSRLFARELLKSMPLARWDLVKALVSLRTLAMSRSVSVSSFGEREFLDNLAPPMTVRVNGDTENPILAVIDRDEIFVATFRYDPASAGYQAVRVQWLRRAPGNP